MRDKLMVFIDGSNLLRETATQISASFRSDKPPQEAVLLCAVIVNVLLTRIKTEDKFYNFKHIRTYWFGSCQGDENYETTLKQTLRSYDMEPVIFRRRLGKEKRVDIAIAREMLINAINKNYDLGLLIAGDEDYLDLVNDVKRLGVRVIGSFYDSPALSKHLKLSFDNFHKLHVWGENRQEMVSALGGTLPP
jgi:uncharacterized LabA/DUF88 family protein